MIEVKGMGGCMWDNLTLTDRGDAGGRGSIIMKRATVPDMRPRDATAASSIVSLGSFPLLQSKVA